MKLPRRGVRNPIDQENEMKPSVDKFLATTKIYLQIFTGMTEAGNAKDKELTKARETRDRIIISSQAVQF